MHHIKVAQPTSDQFNMLHMSSWAHWACDPSEFDWQYPDTEIAYIQQGRAIVTEAGGAEVEIKAGDLVTFPVGLKCKWKVIERIEKVYTLK